MKRIILLIIFSSLLLCKGDAPDFLNYEQSQNKDFVKTLKGKFEIQSYESKAHGLIEVGSKLIIGSPLAGNTAITETAGVGDIFGGGSPFGDIFGHF